MQPCFFGGDRGQLRDRPPSTTEQIKRAVALPGKLAIARVPSQRLPHATQIIVGDRPVLIAGGSAQADDSFYEPPVEGGPQTSQGSGTR